MHHGDRARGDARGLVTPAPLGTPPDHTGGRRMRFDTGSAVVIAQELRHVRFETIVVALVFEGLHGRRPCSRKPSGFRINSMNRWRARQRSSLILLVFNPRPSAIS